MARVSDIRWDVLEIGHLSRNRYWGESEDRAYRAALCTTTLIRCAGGPTIVVDPGLDAPAMHETLRDRSGLDPEAVDLVLLTHFHADHRVGVDAFPCARRVMADAELESVRQTLPVDSEARPLLDSLEPADHVDWRPGLRLIATPGHTPGHYSLFLDLGEALVTVAGDAVMTRDFFLHRDVYFNTWDRERAVATIEEIAGSSDIVVPGHDNSFLTHPLHTARG